MKQNIIIFFENIIKFDNVFRRLRERERERERERDREIVLIKIHLRKLRGMPQAEGTYL